MNTELLNTIKTFYVQLRSERRALAAEFETLKGDPETVARRREIKVQVREYDERIVRLRDTIKESNEAITELAEANAEYSANKNKTNTIRLNTANSNIRRLNTLLTTLAIENGIHLEEELEEEPLDSEEEVEEENRTTNRHTVRNVICGVLGGAALIGLGAHIATVVESQNEEENQEEQNSEKNLEDSVIQIEETNSPSVSEEVKPFETYGKFTDSSNEEQLQARATWYYNTYLANNAGLANSLTLDDIMNDIRMYNGQFRLDNGQPTYNDMDVVESSVDITTMINYDSIHDGTINFTPMVPLFEDGSLAQKAAIDIDTASLKVINAINAKDNEAFVSASQEWGKLLVGMFEYIDATGKYVNINQVDSASAYPLYISMYARYGNTILEYSEANNLNICIDYCIDYNTGEVKQEALSQIIYNINERNIDGVAVRSGNLEEYEDNNLTLPQILCMKARTYFESKYDLEIGRSRSLSK